MILFNMYIKKYGEYVWEWILRAQGNAGRT